MWIPKRICATIHHQFSSISRAFQLDQFKVIFLFVMLESFLNKIYDMEIKLYVYFMLFRGFFLALEEQAGDKSKSCRIFYPT